MNEKFVIVVEVCNKRALTAYTKGLTELNLIWPQLSVHAAQMDLLADAQHEVWIAWRNRQRDRSRMAARDLEIDSDLPSREPFPIAREDVVMKLDGDSYVRNAYIARYKSIYEDLKRMADVAGVALGPFRMTQMHVNELIGWESGSRIQELKDECLSVAARK